MRRFVLLASFSVAMPMLALPLPGVGCAPTAEAAVARLLDSGVVTDSLQREGFRVEAVRVDPLREKAYAMVSSCAERAKPMVAVLLPGRTFSRMREQKTPLVHAGDVVELSAGGSDSQVRLQGRAESAGVAGQEIVVRLSGSLMGDSGVGARLRCRVVSAGVVEVLR
ncbi:MAG: flagella basal body P-ring formation protein FlgA [Acidobacteriaceae bacterium]|nr:flagella basal body P-ring formation protein FlgA [Acidobacteriaceae bacterium]